MEDHNPNQPAELPRTRNLTILRRRRLEQLTISSTSTLAVLPEEATAAGAGAAGPSVEPVASAVHGTEEPSTSGVGHIAEQIVHAANLAIPPVRSRPRYEVGYVHQQSVETTSRSLWLPRPYFNHIHERNAPAQRPRESMSPLNLRAYMAPSDDILTPAVAEMRGLPAANLPPVRRNGETLRPYNDPRSHLPRPTPLRYNRPRDNVTVRARWVPANDEGTPPPPSRDIPSSDIQSSSFNDSSTSEAANDSDVTVSDSITQAILNLGMGELRSGFYMEYEPDTPPPVNDMRALRRRYHSDSDVEEEENPMIPTKLAAANPGQPTLPMNFGLPRMDGDGSIDTASNYAFAGIAQRAEMQCGTHQQAADRATQTPHIEVRDVSAQVAESEENEDQIDDENQTDSRKNNHSE